VPISDDEEREWKVRLMQADIANKNADTGLKDEPRRWEPVKAMSAAFGAGLAVASALIGLITWLVLHLLQSGWTP
jgi:hypothetical protein